MGQAKKRGSFAERQAAAYEAVDAHTATLKAANEHLEKLAEMEALSQKQANTVAAQIIVSHWKHTQMERRMTSSTGLVAK